MATPEQRMFRLRVIVAKEPDHPVPTIVGGISEDTWEVIPPEEWDEEKRKLAAHWLGPDWTAYDYAEAVLHVPEAALSALFSPPINVGCVEVGKS